MTENKKNVSKRIYRMFSLLSVMSLLVTNIGVPNVKAYENTMTISLAKKLALSESNSYQLLLNKIETSKIQYTQAVKSLKLKEKNQTTFRWSPVLSFHFPEELNLSEAFEYKYKPLELQSKIEVLEHQRDDLVYEIQYKASSLFTKIYVLQEKIEYNEERLQVYQETLKKNQKRLQLGLANQNDIDTMQKKVNTIQKTMIADKTSFEANKKKMTEMIGENVEVGYTFESPFVNGEITRDMLEQLIEHTLNYDHSYYQAKVTTENAMLALNTNYQLMKNQYGSKMDMLDSFIDQIKKGEKVKSASFKLRYDEFLKKIDEPWEGVKKIWFVKIPKEWFKGDIDGVRYVEEEPYVLYECALEYQDALLEQKNTEADIRATVTDMFENYISVKKSIETIEEQITEKKEELSKAKSFNLLGKMTYEEYAAIQQEYEELQLELLQGKADYSEILYGLDRLTCGKISSLLEMDDVDNEVTKSGGYSFVVEDEGDGVYYYIHQLASENVFDFGLSVSEDADVELTDFELWIDHMQIGIRTSLAQTIRHLSLDLQQTERVFVRIFNGNVFVDDCEIDPSVYSGKLDITKDYEVVTIEDEVVGSYGIEVSQDYTATINIIPEMDEMYQYYNVMTETGEYLIDEQKKPLAEDFIYLYFTENSLDTLVIQFFDENEKYMYRAKFNSQDKTIYKVEE